MTFTTTTDADGRFRFVNLTSGDYTLSASKPGYLEMALGARRPGSAGRAAPIRLLAGEARDNLSLRLPRAGVISGIVTDEFGDPAFNVPVRAVRFGAGTARAATAAIEEAKREGRGPQPPDITGYVPAFYPSTTAR